MARLTGEQWERLKTKWVTGKYTDSELSREFGVSHTAIKKKSVKENWEQIDQTVIDNAIDSKVKLKQEVSKVSKVSKVETKALEAEIDNLAELKSRLESNALTIADKVPMMSKKVGSAYDLKMLAETNSKLYDTHFKQSAPQVAIQNNNTANAGIKTFSELYGNTES